MTLDNLLADLYRRLVYTASPPAAESTRVRSFLNTTHRQILGLPGLESLRNDTITFASVANQAYYGLPPAIARIEGVTDRTTLLRLRPMALTDLRVFDPGVVSTGTCDAYIPRGLQQVAVQPTAPTGLWVQSTAAGDTQNVFLETIRTGGHRYVGAAVAMTGVTRKAINALVDHIEVTKFYLSSAAVGAVSLYDAAVDGVELARIPIGGTYARYQGVQLYPTPSSAITYHVDYVRTIPEMLNATDEPLLPEDFHWLLVEGTLLKEWTKRDDDRRIAAAEEYQRGIRALKYFVTCQADELPARSRWWPGRSRFGPDFPATRY